jgi:hypothetical protein
MEVLFCTVVAMGLTVGCLPRGCCIESSCSCYQHCIVLDSTIVVALSGVEAAMVVVAVAEALALRALALAGEGPLLLAAALLWLLFLVQFVAA